MQALHAASQARFATQLATELAAAYPDWRYAAPATAVPVVTDMVQALVDRGITREIDHRGVITASARTDLPWPWPAPAFAVLDAFGRSAAWRSERFVIDADTGTWRTILITLHTNVPELLDSIDARAGGDE